ncbi:MAG: hypothetical protein J3Q66DRAFT_388171 [Benniella sp.]|nr:MAG: hypothetical protein J3Q66DRAFT_388171 [Benniella sp.]
MAGGYTQDYSDDPQSLSGYHGGTSHETPSATGPPEGSLAQWRSSQRHFRRRDGYQPLPCPHSNQEPESVNDDDGCFGLDPPRMRARFCNIGQSIGALPQVGGDGLLNALHQLFLPFTCFNPNWDERRIQSCLTVSQVFFRRDGESRGVLANLRLFIYSEYPRQIPGSNKFGRYDRPIEEAKQQPPRGAYNCRRFMWNDSDMVSTTTKAADMIQDQGATLSLIAAVMVAQKIFATLTIDPPSIGAAHEDGCVWRRMFDKGVGPTPDGLFHGHQ